MGINIKSLGKVPRFNFHGYYSSPDPTDIFEQNMDDNLGQFSEVLDSNVSHDSLSKSYADCFSLLSKQNEDIDIDISHRDWFSDYRLSLQSPPSKNKNKS